MEIDWATPLGPAKDAFVGGVVERKEVIQNLKEIKMRKLGHILDPKPLLPDVIDNPVIRERRITPTDTEPAWVISEEEASSSENEVEVKASLKPLKPKNTVLWLYHTKHFFPLKKTQFLWIFLTVLVS